MLVVSGGIPWLANPHLRPPVEQEDDPAPDFVLKDPQGRVYHLRDHIGTGLIVIQFGNFT
jgi:hypothetical protein